MKDLVFATSPVPLWEMRLSVGIPISIGERMPDTATDRVALAKLVRELESQLKGNMDTIFKPAIPLPDHVRYYFTAYVEYLKRALTYPELPQRDLFQRQLDSIQQRLKAPFYTHRDNLGDLAARIGSLASALEATFSNVVIDLQTARAEVDRLTAELEKLRQENADLKARLGKPRILGEG